MHGSPIRPIILWVGLWAGFQLSDLMLFSILIPVFALAALPAAKVSMKSNEPLELRSGFGSATESNSFRSRAMKKSNFAMID